MNMKNLAIVIFIILGGLGSAYCQENPDKSFKLKIVNKKGKPVKNSNVIFQINNSSSPKKIDPAGISVIPGISDKDTLYISAPGYNTVVLPVADLDSIELLFSKKGFKGKDKEVNIGYQTVSPDKNTQSVNHLDVAQTKGYYRDLASYLQGRYGLQIRNINGRAEIVIRGGFNSLHLSPAALIVVDGVILDSFSTANQLYHVSDIKSVDILKEASIYGSRGSNGAVIITTKRGRD